MFKRRLGIDKENRCVGGRHCPDVLELESGDWAVIGEDITDTAIAHLPFGSGCGPKERVVRLPRALLIRVRAEIPATI